MKTVPSMAHLSSGNPMILSSWKVEVGHMGSVVEGGPRRAYILWDSLPWPDFAAAK